MLDGATDIADLDKTEANRALARAYIEEVLIDRRLDRLARYLDPNLIQHSPDLADGIAPLRAALEARSEDGFAIQYETLHKVLAEGNFVLCMSEGRKDGAHTSFYDLFRLSEGMIVEHWDTIETIPPRAEWKNQNGKF